MRPSVGKASLNVVASARTSSFAGNAAFTVAAKQQMSRGQRAAVRRGAVLTKAKVSRIEGAAALVDLSNACMHAGCRATRQLTTLRGFVIAARRQPG